MLAIFFSGVSICFVLSTSSVHVCSHRHSMLLMHRPRTSFHTLSNHSSDVHRLGNRLDHLGIIIVIWASAVPSDYFGFYCHQRLQYLYWAMVSIEVSAFEDIGTNDLLTRWTLGLNRGRLLRFPHHEARLSVSNISSNALCNVRMSWSLHLRSSCTRRCSQRLADAERSHVAVILSRSWCFEWHGHGNLYSAGT